MDDFFSCPLRALPGQDVWRSNHECSHCGSLHPDMALALAGKGAPMKVSTEGKTLLVQADNGHWRPVELAHMTAAERKDLLMRVADTVLEARVKPVVPRKLQKAAPADEPKE